MHSRLTLFLLSTALAVPRVALAQVSDSVTSSIEAQRIIAARIHALVGGAAAVLVRPDSARLGVSASVADLLRTVPQILVRTNSRGEVELSVRGSDSRQVGLTLNGLPLSPSWDGRADASLVPLTGVSEMVYVRSTGSVLGGPNAIGGTVELRVIPPERAVRSVALGSDETGARLASIAVGGRVGQRNVDDSIAPQLYYRAGLGLRERDGITRARGVTDTDPTGALRTNTDVRQRDAFVAGGWKAENGATVDALLSGYATERGVAPELHVATPRRWRYPQHDRTLAHVRAASPLLLTGTGTTRAEVSAGVLNAHIRISAFSDEAFSTLAGQERGEEQVLSARASVTHATARGHEFRSALTVNEVRYDETLNADPTARYRQRLASLGAETQLVAGARSLVTAGIAVDQGRTLEAGGKTATPDRTIAGWRLGATTEPRVGIRLNAAVSRRARFPALRELYSGALDRFEPNPTLRPEQLTAMEAGITFGADSGLALQVVGFHHALDDAIVRVPYGETDRFLRINRDALRSTGAEVGLTWAGARGPDARFDIVLQRARIREAALGAAFRNPEHMPSVRAMLDLQQAAPRGVVLGLTAMHIGSQYCVDPQGSGNRRIDAQGVLGVSAERGWALGGTVFRGLRLVLAADNVTDAAMYEQCGLPRAGRTLRVGLSMN